MKKYLIAACVILSLSNATLGNADNNPVSAGATQSRNSGGLTLDGAMGNPALVGLERRPRGGLSLLPTSVALWSDKAASPFNGQRLLIDPFNARNPAAYYVSALFKESFGLTDGLTPEEASEILTRELRGGIGVYAGVRSSPIVFATRGFGLNVKTYVDVDVRIPEGFLLPLFSETDGLLAGRSLDFSDLRVSAIWASEAAIKLGYSTTVPFMRDYLNLDKGAAGVGIKLILGHSYFNAEMDKKSAFVYDSASNKYIVSNAKLDIVNIGTGLYGDYNFSDSLFMDNPINGQGWGLDLGAVFHNNRHALSVDVQDIGMILWNGKQVYKAAIDFKDTSGNNVEFDLRNLSEGFGNLFHMDSANLEPTNKTYAMWLPASLNIGYTYSLDFSEYDFDILLGYLTTSLHYNQQLILGPGKNTYVPRLSAGGALGLLAGYLPIRYGLIAGGPEKLASAAGVGLDAKYISLDASYKAVGSPFLISKKGFEYAAGLTFRWGWRRNRNYVKDKPEEPAAEPIHDEPPETPPLPVLEEPPPAEEKVMEEVLEEPVIYLTMLPPEPKPEPQLTVEEAQVLNISQQAINFQTGSAVLAQSSYGALENIANLLKQHPNIRYEVQGHTDSQGDDVYNLLLSAERAASVKYYLMSRGAPEESMISIGYGKNMPITENNTAEGRAKNRRVEFVQIWSQDQYDTLKKFEGDMTKRLTKRALEVKRKR
ncbi:MAG: DUF5723 family protein [Chitinispirillales bacterium]|jgi:outer membrane protein OmpA-like peptidoglycan-associated protein|nr:DUF5723 family protein [Chitinispirillales bacterium]